MKKKILLISAVLIINIAYFVPFNFQHAVSVNASYFNCYRQLITVQSWKNWLPGIRNVYDRDSSLYNLSKFPQGIKLSIPGTFFLIKQQGSAQLLIKKVNDTGEENYSYTIIPGGSVLSATIMVTYRTTIIKSVIQPHADLEKTEIDAFKRFMESAKSYYGFDIKNDVVDEKKIIVKKITVPAVQIYIRAAELQKQLLNYIKLKNLIKTGSVMVQYNTKNGDSLEMLIGIPVNKQIASDKKFDYMYIPKTNTLTADFKGKYYDRKKIYSAMSDYLQDKYLHAKIAPYEEFISSFPTRDNDFVKFRLIYSIF